LNGGLIGWPQTIRNRLRKFEQSNVDSIILLNQAGRNRHDHICESLELFADKVMPEFHGREAAHQDWKRKVLGREIELEELDTAPYRERQGVGKGVAIDRPPNLPNGGRRHRPANCRRQTLGGSLRAHCSRPICRDPVSAYNIRSPRCRFSRRDSSRTPGSGAPPRTSRRSGKARKARPWSSCSWP
jgi:hypothetical protein